MNRTGARALTIVSMLAVAGLTLPGRAATNTMPPVLKKTSVDAGWSQSGTTVAAAYDRALAQRSTVEVRDTDGVLIPGSVTIDGSTARTLTWQAIGPLEGDAYALMHRDALFTVTFRAYAVTQDLTAYPNATTDARTFDVDVRPPAIPTAFTTPAGQPVDGGVVVVNDGTTLHVSGTASDLGADAASAMSGIAMVQLHFYNASATTNPFDPTRAGREVIGLRRTLDATTCCEQAMDFAWDIDALPSKGYWNVKVSAVDASSWRSKESEPVKVLWLGATN